MHPPDWRSIKSTKLLLRMDIETACGWIVSMQLRRAADDDLASGASANGNSLMTWLCPTSESLMFEWLVSLDLAF